MNRPERLCIATFDHIYLRPQTEHRLCCATDTPTEIEKDMGYE